MCSFSRWCFIFVISISFVVKELQRNTLLRPSILSLIRAICDAAVDQGIALEAAGVVARLSADGTVRCTFPSAHSVDIVASNRQKLVEGGLLAPLVHLAVEFAEDTRTVCLLTLSEFAEIGMERVNPLQSFVLIHWLSTRSANAFSDGGFLKPWGAL